MQKIVGIASLLGVIAFLLVGCGTNGSASADKFSIVIQADSFSKTISKPDFVQKLYEKARALPQADPARICPTIARPKYKLTFVKDEKTLLSVIADGSGCGSFIIDKNNIRQTDDSFWLLIHQALAF